MGCNAPGRDQKQSLGTKKHTKKSRDTHCAMLCYAMLCYAMLCYAMLRHAMPCHAMLCCAMLCYAIVCFARGGHLLAFVRDPPPPSRNGPKAPRGEFWEGQRGGVWEGRWGGV